MPVPVFTSPHPFEPERVHAAAVYCSDGRFGDQVDDFLHDHLLLPNYDRLVVPGGPAWLGVHGAPSATEYGLIRDQLDFLVQVHQLERVVLIAHFGCAYYLRQGGTPEDRLPDQLHDLADAARTIHGWYSGLKLETYLARAVEGRVQFEPVEL